MKKRNIFLDVGKDKTKVLFKSDLKLPKTNFADRPKLKIISKPNIKPSGSTFTRMQLGLNSMILNNINSLIFEIENKSPKTPIIVARDTGSNIGAKVGSKVGAGLGVIGYSAYKGVKKGTEKIKTYLDNRKEKKIND